MMCVARLWVLCVIANDRDIKEPHESGKVEEGRLKTSLKILPFLQLLNLLYANFDVGSFCSFVFVKKIVVRSLLDSMLKLFTFAKK